MFFTDFLFGKPLPTLDERAERIGAAAGIPIFGLDALSSAAYGPEAALTLLIPLGAAGVATIVPISSAIILLLIIVYFSYRQTIDAYPGGGGSYTVARENLGVTPGLLAAAALMIDYVLVVAVGFSGRWRPGIRRTWPATSYRAALPGDSVHDHYQSAWRSRDGRDLHASHLSLHRDAADRHRHRMLEIRAQRWPSVANNAASPSPDRPSDGDGRGIGVAAYQSLCVGLAPR